MERSGLGHNNKWQRFLSDRISPIGRYSIAIEAEGFSKRSLPPFDLEVLQTATFNVKMSVGSSSATVDVTEAAPILNTNDATLGTTFTANAIQNVR